MACAVAGVAGTGSAARFQSHITFVIVGQIS